MVEFAKERPFKIAVDLTHLLKGGRNGGIKPFIFEYLRWLGEQQLVPIKLFFLTHKRSHAEVRPLARFGDKLICLVDEPRGDEIHSPSSSPAEMAWFDPPPDLIAQLGADLLYCPFGQCSWSYPGIPTLATVVDVLHRDYPFSLSPPDVAYREEIFREITQKADQIQVISKFTLDRMVHHYRFPREQMFCSHIAIHHRLMPKHAPAVEIETRQPYFLYPANAWKHKNHEVLLLAYRIYRTQAGTKVWDLVLTGHDDDAMRAILHLAVTLGIDSQVHFLGHLSNERFSKVWNEAGVLVFPSFHEGFGIPLVEAMAFGLPVICSNATALPEVGGEACLYFDPTKPLALAEMMSRTTADAALRAELRNRGYERLKTFSFEQDARQFLAQMILCVKQTAKRTVKGFYADGWTAPQAFFGTPNWSRHARLELSLRPMQAARSLKVYHDANLIGAVNIPAGEPCTLRLPLWPTGHALTLSVPNAARLSDTDHRTHGVNIASLRLRASDGIEVDLLVS